MIHENTRTEPSRLLKNAPRTLADPLCGSLCDLCVSVVSVFVRIFTTETQRTTEIAQRNRYPARADDFFSSPLRVHSASCGLVDHLPTGRRLRAFYEHH